MIQSFFAALAYAIESIRINFFHTLLSVLGITIGVSALIVILSMIDGLESYARDQLGSTTSVKVVEISSVTHHTINGLRVKKPNPVVLSSSIYEEIQSTLTAPFKSYRVANANKQISVDDSLFGSRVYYSDKHYSQRYSLQSGDHLFSESNLGFPNRAVVNDVFAQSILLDSLSNDTVIGKNVTIDTLTYQIIGVVKGLSKFPEVLFPIDALTPTQAQTYPPFIILKADNVEDVSKIKASLDSWLEKSPYSKNEILILSQDFRVRQATRSFMLFRIIMGLIVGISVIVGGIGVMNVLIISVTQRTKEIGIRKAVGSRKRDIFTQFLSESIIISLFGTIVGIVLGVIASLVIAPIVHLVIEVPFHPTFSLITIFMIVLFSMGIGMLFGTYPAYKASQLHPIDALRRE